MKYLKQITSWRHSASVATKTLVLLITFSVVFWLTGRQTVVANQLDVFEFVETGDSLTLNVDVKLFSDSTTLGTEEGRIVWQYVGPAVNEAIQTCDDFSWVSLSAQAQTAEATLQEGEKRDNPQRAFLTLELPDNATNGMRYCFRVPISVDGAVTNHNRSYALSQATDATPSAFKFDIASPIAGTLVPANIKVNQGDDVSVNQSTWQYARVATVDDCHDANEGLEFNQPSATNNTVVLTAEDAGVAFCFRAANAEAEEGIESYVYGSYQVASAATETADSDRNYTWMIIGLVVLGLGIVAVFIIRSN